MPRDTELLNVLVQKYVLLRQEALEVLKHYRSHVLGLQVFLTALLAAGALLITRPGLSPTVTTWLPWWLGAVALTAMWNYLLLNNLEALYGLILLGQRMRLLERRINGILDTHALIWETGIVPLFYKDRKPVRGLTNPNFDLGVHTGILTAIFSIVLPCIVYWTIAEAFPGVRQIFDAGVFTTESAVVLGFCVAGVLYSGGSAVFTFIRTVEIAVNMRGSILPLMTKLEATSIQPFNPPKSV